MVAQTAEGREKELHLEVQRAHTGGRAAWLYLTEQEQVRADNAKAKLTTEKEGK